MITSLKNPLPKSAYLRLLEHQSKLRPHAYHPDLPLVLFITLSRVASGLALVSPFFSPSSIWVGISLACMISATGASISHLNVPIRFLTMLRNHKSQLVWEIRLAGALTIVLVLELTSLLGILQGFQNIFPKINFILAILFLISTGWAYRFDSHPAWKTSILPIYYIASAFMMGLSLRSIEAYPQSAPSLYSFFLFSEIALLSLFRCHLKKSSPFSLREMTMGRDRWIFLAFLWFTLLLPGLLAIILWVGGDHGRLMAVLATSCLMGIFLERILFFRVERPAFFFSFIENLDEKGRHWIRG